MQSTVPTYAVNHDILTCKLEKYDMRGNALKIIKNFVTNRKQFVSINYTSSKKQNISCGVPQGSVLGPLLFSIYINNLPKASNFETRPFADDTVHN